MKRVIFLLVLPIILIPQVIAQSGDDIVTIPDTAFLYALIDVGVDSNEDSLISFNEAEAVSELPVINRGINDMTGIEAFVMLDSLDCTANNIGTLNLSTLSKLGALACQANPIDSLDLSNNPALRILWAPECDLTTLDLSNNPLLEILDVGSSQLSSLDLSASVNLVYLGLSDNSLESLDVSNNTALKILYLTWNQLSSLDVSANVNLEVLGCTDNNLKSLDVSNNLKLEMLMCVDNSLTSLILPDSCAIWGLDIGMNYLESVDVTGCPHLEWFQPWDNNLTSLDLSNNPLLNWLSCEINQLTELDLSNNPELNFLWCGENLLATLDLTNNTKLGSIPSQYGNLNVDYMPSLGEVCVWDSFSGDDLDVSFEGSPNVCFEKDCDGCCGSCDTTGIEGFDDTGFKVYPNPTSDILTIETASFGPHSIRLHSLNGQEIYAETFTGTLHQIDLSFCKKGIYFLYIRSDNTTATRKVIKL